MSENTKQRQAFELYWRLGAERSVERLHAELAATGKAISLSTLYRWSARYQWQNRIAAVEREARQAEDEARLAALREMAERQAKEALLLQQKGVEWLAAKGPEDATAEAAIRAIVEGARLERLARGEPTERQEIRGSVETRLMELSDDELDRLIEHAAGAVGGEGEA